MKQTGSRFFRLTIARKLLLGFLSCGFLTILIALIALTSLRLLNQINHRIIAHDVPLIDIADKLSETLLAQELYGRRSFILKSSEMEGLFSKRSEEFKRLLKQMRDLPDVSTLPLDRLASLHEEYNQIFKTGLKKGEAISSRDFQNLDRIIREKQEELIQLLNRISHDAREDRKEKSLKTLSVGRLAFWMTAGLTVGGLLMGISIALLITRNISGSIRQLKLSTVEISAGKFDHLPELPNHDELGDLSLAFQNMAQRLKHLEETSLDANPLTHLPGGLAVEKVLNKRLKEEIPLAFCQLDLSYFKAFNDRYGYARGNEVIQATAKLLSEVLKGEGKEGDFVGHIGGDDFAVITSPKRYKAISFSIINSFDKMILDFYDPQDREEGCILSVTRQGEKVTFPIMTLSIAVVTNETRRLQNHIQVGEIAAELKAYAKSFPRSIYVVDRRGNRDSHRPD